MRGLVQKKKKKNDAQGKEDSFFFSSFIKRNETDKTDLVEQCFECSIASSFLIFYSNSFCHERSGQEKIAKNKNDSVIFSVIFFFLFIDRVQHNAKNIHIFFLIIRNTIELHEFILYSKFSMQIIWVEMLLWSVQR